MMMAGLAAASFETIFRRTLLMAQGQCSAAEYHKMVAEKAAAVQAATMAVMTGQGPGAAVSAFLKPARANAKRLRAQR